MVYYDTDIRLQLAREHADRLAAEMRRSRRLTPEVAGFPRLARLGSALAGHIESLRRHKGSPTPAYDA
jgi:hypothetical protein